MAKFSKGQRVSVTSSNFFGREGVITFVALPKTITLTAESVGDIRSALDQRYAVRFDGDDRPQNLGERELEAI